MFWDVVLGYLNRRAREAVLRRMRRQSCGLVALRIDEGGDGGCGVSLLAGEDVAVDVERERYGGVAESFGCDAGVGSGREQVRRMCMAQVVQTDARQA